MQTEVKRDTKMVPFSTQGNLSLRNFIKTNHNEIVFGTTNVDINKCYRRQLPLDRSYSLQLQFVLLTPTTPLLLLLIPAIYGVHELRYVSYSFEYTLYS